MSTKQRLREKHSILTVGTSSYWPPEHPDGSVSVDQPVTNVMPILGKWSRMRDFITKGVRTYNDCDHLTIQCKYGIAFGDGTVDPRAHFAVGDTDLDGSYHYPVGRILYDIRKQHGLEAFVSYPAKRVANWLSDKQLPTKVIVDRDPFESSFSIWFLLVDLVELPKLALQIFSRPIIRRRELIGGKTLKQLADDDLLTKFGILATYRDFADFVTVLKRFRDGIEIFTKAQEVIYRWHGEEDELSHCVPDPDTNSVTGLEKALPWIGGIRPGLSVLPGTTVLGCKFTRTMCYRLKCPELKSWLSRLKQFIDAFGVLDPAALWDAVGFSFLVDWFLPVGSWLHKWGKPRLFQGSIEVVDYCESMKCTTVVDLALGAEREVDIYNPSGFKYLCSLGREEHTTYVRRQFTPDVAKFGSEDRHPLLSIRQAVIAAGLAAQRIPRPGDIGEFFQGISSLPDDPPIPADRMAEIEHASNQRFAQKERENYLKRHGSVALRKFELKSARQLGSGVDLLDRRATRGLRGQVNFFNMRKVRK